MGTPGLAATFSAPGMWPTAYSRAGRESNTTAVLFSRTCFISAVEISTLFSVVSARVAS